MLADSGLLGCAGCSTIAHPCVRISSVVASRAKMRRSLPMQTWYSSLIVIASKPQRYSALRTGCGPLTPAISFSFATVHVSQGGPAMNATTLRSLIALSQYCLVLEFLTSPWVRLMTISKRRSPRRIAHRTSRGSIVGRQDDIFLECMKKHTMTAKAAWFERKHSAVTQSLTAAHQILNIGEALS